MTRTKTILIVFLTGLSFFLIVSSDFYRRDSWYVFNDDLKKEPLYLDVGTDYLLYTPTKTLMQITSDGPKYLISGVDSLSWGDNKIVGYCYPDYFEIMSGDSHIFYFPERNKIDFSRIDSESDYYQVPGLVIEKKR